MTDDAKDLVEEMEKSIYWFCEMAVIPTPLDLPAKDKILQRMLNVGWIKRAEYETYLELTKPEDD